MKEEPDRTFQVNNEFRILDESSLYLLELVDALQKRLTPILRSSPSLEKSSGEDIEPVLCELAEDIRRTRFNLTTAKKTLLEILDGLQIEPKV